MPTIEENAQLWASAYDWATAGEEWSVLWGDSTAQWYGAILPRIHPFVHGRTFLEIAPGFGRWTHYLRNHCDRLIVVDLAEKCIRACQERFADDSRIVHHVNDGKSLAMIPDESIDFVFSFDSLVHAEADVFDAYLRQLAHKLTLNGVGFIHHSNIGEYKRAFAISRRIPRLLRDPLVTHGILDDPWFRGFTMTARTFERLCEDAGLCCVSQERVNWVSRRLIDCFSLFTRKGSIWARPNQVADNPRFMREAESIKRLAHLYTMQANNQTGHS